MVARASVARRLLRSPAVCRFAERIQSNPRFVSFVSFILFVYTERTQCPKSNRTLSVQRVRWAAQCLYQRINESKECNCKDWKQTQRRSPARPRHSLLDDLGELIARARFRQERVIVQLFDCCALFKVPLASLLEKVFQFFRVFLWLLQRRNSKRRCVELHLRPSAPSLCFDLICFGLLTANGFALRIGGFPTTISYIMHPNAHTSACLFVCLL